MVELKNVLITGGSGNVAEFLCKELEDKYQITLFDRALPSAHRYFPHEVNHPFIFGDLTSFEDCTKAIQHANADAIIHMGAIPWSTVLQPGQSMRTDVPLPEDETMRVNVMGTYYLMDAARRLGVKRVVFASSFYVLGLGFRVSDKPFRVEYLPIDEDHPLRPEDTYSLSKLIGEEIMAAFSRSYGMQTIALRLQAVDGKTARGLEGPLSMVPSNPPPRPEWKGGPTGTTWEFADVRDVALACRLSLEAEGLEPFEAFYISTDSTLDEPTADVIARACPDLAAMAKNLKGQELIISIEKARKKLGYEPQHSWRK